MNITGFVSIENYIVLKQEKKTPGVSYCFVSIENYIVLKRNG